VLRARKSLFDSPWKDLRLLENGERRGGGREIAFTVLLLLAVVVFIARIAYYVRRYMQLRAAT